jgi:hypothetical protein
MRSKFAVACPISISRRTILSVLAGVLMIQLSGCTTLWRAKFLKPDQVIQMDKSAPFLKAHTYSGEVFVLQHWQLQEDTRMVTGHGIHYDAARIRLAEGDLQVPFEQVAILETNRPETVITKWGFAVLGVMTGATLAVGIACLSNPKACFGSCPTFYASDGEKLVLQAEGFSSSVARTLEQTDIDAMFTARPTGGELKLTMTNDALETHFVRSVRVLAVPKPAGRRVFRAGQRFVPARALHAPIRCTAPGGDCLAEVADFDQREYLSETDGRDLAAREDIELSFPRTSGPVGLVLAGRNSLLNTFLIYQALAYMGLQAGEWIQKLERGGDRARQLMQESGRLLGDVEVRVRTRSRGWVPAGAFAEIGPIAKEVQLFPLPEDLPEGEVQIRLHLTKGYWKIDALALAELLPEVKPVAVEVSRVIRGKDGQGPEDRAALARLLDPAEHLVTYPGDAYTLIFRLPEGPQELFLESRGFYYEWIRNQWLPEEDQDAIAALLLDPAAAFRQLAPAYKRIEGTMEAVFWQSQFGR